jgi:multidrug resistance efflux pump
LLGVVTLLALLVGAGLYYAANDKTSDTIKPMLTSIERGAFDHIVLDQGEVESSANVEIRCEVRTRTGSTGTSTSIIDVIAEGTVVKEGDWLITFDSSALEQEKSRQKIVVNTSEASMIQAKAVYDTAVIARNEYIEGTYNEQKKAIQNEIFVAEENLTRADLSLKSVERLAARGLVGLLQMESEQFRVDAARNELELAKKKLEVLENYTKPKMLTQLDSDIRAAEVTYKNAQDSYQEEHNNLRDIEDQITKCKVVAPQAGQVVYANVQSSRSGSEFVVEPGVSVRERQVIIRLPDPNKMQVRAKISESRINLVRTGMPVTIRIDAFGEKSVRGEVTKVNRYAEPGNWWSSTNKEYVTLISITDPPPETRVGLTAEVLIHVDRREDALQIPVQAVYERGGKTFCLVENGEKWDTREIAIAATNDKMVVLDEKGSEPFQLSDQVVLNPRKHLDKFDTSRFPSDEAPAPPGEIPVAAGGPASGITPGAGGAAGETAGKASPGGEGQGPGAGGAMAGGPGGAAKGGGQPSIMERFDTNADGKVSSDELPEGLRDRLKESGADTNGDGSFSAGELGAAMAKLRAAGGGPGGPGGPGGFGGGRPGGGAP